MSRATEEQMKSDVSVMTPEKTSSIHTQKTTSWADKVRMDCSGEQVPVILSHKESKAKTPTKITYHQKQTSVVQLQPDHRAKFSHVDSIAGSFHQNHTIFNQRSRGRQCMAIALAALVKHTHMREVHKWSQKDLDMILLEGDRLFLTKKAVIDAADQKYLGAFDFNAEEEVFGKTFSLNISFVQGRLRSVSDKEKACFFVTLKTALEEHLSVDNTCLFTMCFSTCAIISHNGTYAIVDSHARGTAGMPNADGSSVVVFHKSISEVHNHLNQVAAAFGASNVHFELNIVSVSLKGSGLSAEPPTTDAVSDSVCVVEEAGSVECSYDGDSVCVVEEAGSVECSYDGESVCVVEEAGSVECSYDGDSVCEIEEAGSVECSYDGESVCVVEEAGSVECSYDGDSVCEIEEAGSVECSYDGDSVCVVEEAGSVGQCPYLSVKPLQSSSMALNDVGRYSVGLKAWNTGLRTKGNETDVGHKRQRTQIDNVTLPLPKKTRIFNKRTRDDMESTSLVQGNNMKKAKVDDDVTVEGCAENVLQFNPLSENVCKALCKELNVEFESCSVKQSLDFGDAGVPCLNESTEGDGNCFFRAVSQAISGTQKHHMRLRLTAVKHLEEHAHEYHSLLNEEHQHRSVSEYIKQQKMSRAKTWATQFEIQATADCIGVDIYTFYQGKWLRFKSSQNQLSAEGIYLQNHVGHYEHVVCVKKGQESDCYGLCKSHDSERNNIRERQPKVEINSISSEESVQTTAGKRRKKNKREIEQSPTKKRVKDSSVSKEDLDAAIANGLKLALQEQQLALNIIVTYAVQEAVDSILGPALHELRTEIQKTKHKIRDRGEWLHPLKTKWL